MRMLKSATLPIVGAAVVVGLAMSDGTVAGPHKRTLPITQGKDVLANDPDLFLGITTDADLGHQTRDQNLAMAQIYGKIYWEAWNCKDKPCDDAQKAKIRSVAKLVPRTKENWGLLYKPAS